MHQNSSKANVLFLTISIILLTWACTRPSEGIDLVHNEAQKHQAFNQILDNPELQQEFIFMLLKNEEAWKRIMRDSQFTGEFFKMENMNYIWDNNPGIDSAVVDNITTRMHTDTNFMKLIDDRMESGTPTGTR